MKPDILQILLAGDYHAERSTRVEDFVPSRLMLGEKRSRGMAAVYGKASLPGGMMIGGGVIRGPGCLECHDGIFFRRGAVP